MKRFLNNYRLRLSGKNKTAFTVMESVMATAVVAIVGVVLYGLVSGTSLFFAKISQTVTSQNASRIAMQTISSKLYEAMEQPVLLDANGNEKTAVDGPDADNVATRKEVWRPSEGVRWRWTLGNARKSKGNRPQTDSYIILEGNHVGVIKPRDIVECLQPKINTPVQSVVLSGSDTRINLSGSIASLTTGNYQDDGTATIKDASMIQIKRDSAFVVVETNAANSIGELRYYASWMPMAAVGATAFNNRANYAVVTANVWTGTSSRLQRRRDQIFSFSGDPTAAEPSVIIDPEYRAVRVWLQSRANQYRERTNTRFNTTLAVATSCTWKSAVRSFFATAAEIPIATPTMTPTPTPVPTPSPSPSPRPTPSPSPTARPTASPVPTASPRPTASPVPTASPRPTARPTASPVPTASPRPTASPVPTATPAPTPRPTATPRPTPTYND